MRRGRDDAELSLELTKAEIEDGPDESGGEMLRLRTSRGDIRGRLHRAARPNGAGILWVFGAGGGLGGPAGGVYERLGARFAARGVASLQVDYRLPADLPECVLDTLAGIAFVEAADLAQSGRIALVGHSFGGAVVIRAAAAQPDVAAVAALSSQTYGADCVSDLGARPLFVAHGEDDEVLPVSCSRSLYDRASGPRELILYPGCRHGLDACRDDLDRDLSAWLERVLGLPPATPAARPAA